MYNTIRLLTLTGSSGTGFVFNFKIGDLFVPVIITNKHVVNNNPKETMRFLIHLREGEEPSKENFDVTLVGDWIFHPNKDLCFCFLGPIINEVKSRFNKDIFYQSIDETLIYNESKLEELSALEPVVMVGYPNGLWDQLNNFPIFRTGFTSSHPAYDFNEKSIGLVDMACFPGSSGSPIFIINENGYSDKSGTTYIGARRIIFLGVLFAGPTMNLEGEIVIKTIPTQEKFVSSTYTMINLGYYVKAYELIEFRPIIEDIIKKNNH